MKILKLSLFVFLLVVMVIALSPTSQAQPDPPTIDGLFTTATEWVVGSTAPSTPDPTIRNGVTVEKGRYSLLYFFNDVDYLYIMNDWYIDIADDAGSSGGPLDYNIFEFDFDNDGTFEWTIHIYADGDLKVVDENGQEYDPSQINNRGIQGEAGFGSSPNQETPHRMYELRIKHEGIGQGFFIDPKEDDLRAPPPPPMKVCMPDFGQHSENWCWVAALANSVWWYSNNGYPLLLDDTSVAGVDRLLANIDPDSQNPAVTDWYDDSVGYRKLLRKIAESTWRDWEGNRDGQKDPGEETYKFSEPVWNWDFLLGIQAFLNAQGVGYPGNANGLYVYEIADPTIPPDVAGPTGPTQGPQTPYGPPPNPQPPGIPITWRPPTLNDYMRELTRCEDVLLWIDLPGVDHVVTAVDANLGARLLGVSDPWTHGNAHDCNPPVGQPDHNNTEVHDELVGGNWQSSYDALQVTDDDPLTVIYDGVERRVIKMICVSPGWFVKESMPDFGQHSENWCWVAALANSFWWYSKNGYPELVPPDFQQIDPDSQNPAVPDWYDDATGYRRLLRRIAETAWRDWEGNRDGQKDPGEETYKFSEPIWNWDLLLGIQKYLNDRGVGFPGNRSGLMLHEIADPAVPPNVAGPTGPTQGVQTPYGPTNEVPGLAAKTIWRAPTFDDYKRELRKCQDILLWLDLPNVDHIVTGVSFDAEAMTITVSDPWTHGDGHSDPGPGEPDHNNSELHDQGPYEVLPVVSSGSDPFEPLIVIYDGVPVQVIKLVFVSPVHWEWFWDIPPAKNPPEEPPPAFAPPRADSINKLDPPSGSNDVIRAWAGVVVPQSNGKPTLEDAHIDGQADADSDQEFSYTFNVPKENATAEVIWTKGLENVHVSTDTNGHMTLVHVTGKLASPYVDGGVALKMDPGDIVYTGLLEIESPLSWVTGANKTLLVLIAWFAVAVGCLLTLYGKNLKRRALDQLE